MNGAKPRRYIVATDVGGTCTDTIVFAEGEPVHIGKALSTPPNFGEGVINSVRSCAKTMGISIEELFAQTQLFVHGSTVVDNTVLTRDGAVTGLVTTAGFEDTLAVTRGAWSISWLYQPLFSGASPANTTSGRWARTAAGSAVMSCVTPGPQVTVATPTSRLLRAYAIAAATAQCSCRT